ncbi:MAG: nitrilase-related carbon-nitrogen hydrolase [Phototrophicaceae bacterium]
MQVKIALSQIYPQVGNLERNLEKHLHHIEEARQQQADLIVFPELSLVGYYVMDLVSELAQTPSEQDPIFARLLKESQTIDIMVGFIQEDSRHRYYIAAAYLSGGKVVHIHRKVYLPTYGIFDDARYFSAGNRLQAFDTRFGRVGMLICEDMWHLSSGYVLWMDGADLLLCHSNSPTRGIRASEDGRSTVGRWVDVILQSYSAMFTTYVVHVNRVGYEDGKNFWGGSSVVNPNGDTVIQAPYFEETLLLHTIDLAQVHRTRSVNPLLRDERPSLVQAELERILREQTQ